uniref:Uncharacterized protein n=1 Tax=Arundo donax TaxID=35708 RepID=A0A0A9BXG8_ARUDO
MSGMVCFGGSR